MIYSIRFKRRKIELIAGIAIVAFLAGCAGGIKTMSGRSLEAPAIKYCHDAIGHINGNKPWILGGNCCCTPTQERFQSYKIEGTVSDDMTYDQFLKNFADKGIITDLDVDYRGCNCRGALGPHVVFGGKCMVTPTPGTKTFEDVTAGGRTTAARR